MSRFFYALKMWSMGFEFRRAWWFYESETGRMLRVGLTEADADKAIVLLQEKFIETTRRTK